MKRTLATVLVVALTVVPASGCGTVCNLVGSNPEVYGGIQRDLAVLGGCADGTGMNSGDGRGALVLFGLVAAELAATGIGDTLTIPLVMGLTAERPAGHRVGAGTPAAETVTYSAGAAMPAASQDQPVEPRLPAALVAECSAAPAAAQEGAGVKVPAEPPSPEQWFRHAPTGSE